MTKQEIDIKATKIADKHSYVYQDEQTGYETSYFECKESALEMAEWMQEQKDKEIGELERKVSELTEALDASHVFCEGNKEKNIQQVINFLRQYFVFDHHYGMSPGGFAFFAKQVEQAMKGE